MKHVHAPLSQQKKNVRVPLSTAHINAYFQDNTVETSNFAAAAFLI